VKLINKDKLKYLNLCCEEPFNLSHLIIWNYFFYIRKVSIQIPLKQTNFLVFHIHIHIDIHIHIHIFDFNKI